MVTEPFLKFIIFLFQLTIIVTVMMIIIVKTEKKGVKVSVEWNDTTQTKSAIFML